MVLSAQLAIFPGMARESSVHDIKTRISRFFIVNWAQSYLTINTMVWPKDAKIVDTTIVDLVVPSVRSMENRTLAFS